MHTFVQLNMSKIRSKMSRKVLKGETVFLLSFRPNFLINEPAKKMNCAVKGNHNFIDINVKVVL